MDRLKQDGISCFSPLIDRWKSNKSAPKKRLCRLLPGYVFMECEDEPVWHEIRKLPGVICPLTYPDGSYALRGGDITFVEWLKRFDAVIEVSLVVQEGTKIQFVEGPLKNMSGKIVKVNKKRRMAAVQFGEGDGLFKTIWCSFDYMQGCADSTSVPQKYV